jgi:hypothetical protein
LLYYWCNSCDPYQAGAIEGKLTIITTYRQALDHISLSCKKRSRDYIAIVKALAHAKGLPDRVTEGQAEAFFN